MKREQREKSPKAIPPVLPKDSLVERGVGRARLRDYERVIQGLREMIAVVDRNYRYLIANQTFLDQRGVRREDVIGRHISEVLDPVVFETVMKPKLDECFAGSTVRYEMNYLYPELGARDLAVSYFPIEGPRGIDRAVCIIQDITERKRADSALKHSLQQLAEAQHLSHIGSWNWDLQTNQRSWSEELYRIFGLHPDRPALSVDEALVEIVHPADREMFVSAVQASIASGQPCSVTYRIVRPDGVERIVHSRGTVILDESGNAIRMFGTAHDVTERKRAENELRVKDSAIESSITPTGFADLDGRITHVNRAFLDLFGYERSEEVVGRLNTEFVPRREDVGPIMEALREGGSWTGEIEAIKQDGALIYLTLNAGVVRDAGGKTLGTMATFVDISERKRAEIELREAERKYREIFENAGEGIFQTSPDGQTLTANPALASMLGFASPEELIASRTNVGAQGYVHPELRAELKRLLDQRDAVQGFEFEAYRADGTTVWLSESARAVRDADGRLLYYEGLVKDITERKRAEERLRQSESQLAEAQQYAHLGSWTRDLDTNEVILSDELFRLFGMQPQQPGADHELFLERVHPEDRPWVQAMTDEAIKNRQACSFEFRVIRADGVERTLHERIRVTLDEETGAVRLFGTTQDITERKRAEATSASFATLARKLSGARTQSDAGRIIAETARELFGWDACNLDLYDQDRDEIIAILNVVTLDGDDVDVTPMFTRRAPTPTSRQVIDTGPLLLLREQPIQLPAEAGLDGDVTRPWASIMAVPIQQGTKIIGLLSIQSYTLRAYDEEALKAFELLADHCSEALNRISTEQSLRETEERYRDLVENSHELICTHDLNGLILSANPAAAAALGLDLDEFVGKGNIRDILAPSYRDQLEEYLEGVKAHRAMTGLMVVQTRSGEERVWEYYNSLRTEGVAEPIVRGMARDITEQRKAAKALRESEERYRELFENSRDAIYVHDLSGRYLSVNRAAEELSGYTREEIIGKHYAYFLSAKHLRDARESFCIKLDTPVETTYEAEVVCRNGTRRPVEVSSRIIMSDGVPTGIQGTVRDITERKRAQEALQTFSRRVLEAQEAERQNISRELHDEIGQVLTAVSLNLQTIKTLCNTAACAPRLDESVQIMEEALTKVRELSLELRPSLLDDLGLAAALRWYVARYRKRSGIVTEVTGDADLGVIPSETKTACFRIAQEALTNVARHARATNVSVHVANRNGQLHLVVSDNGIGFESRLFMNGASSSRTLGLRGMFERARAVRGRLEINSAPGKGTRLLVNLPVTL